MCVCMCVNLNIVIKYCKYQLFITFYVNKKPHPKNDYARTEKKKKNTQMKYIWKMCKY